MKRRRVGWSLAILSSVGGWTEPAYAAPCTSTTSSITVEDQADLTTLNEAVNCTGGDEIAATWTASLELTDTIAIGSGTYLVIKGSLDAAAVGTSTNTSMFDVSSGGSLNISEMTLSGGYALQGGAIYSDGGTIRIDACLVTGNTASDGDGGAVWATGGDVTITDSEFSHNVASGRGGAIFAIDVNLTVRDNTVFDTNTAEQGGGVFCAGSSALAGASEASCTFDQVTFVSNNASTTEDVDLDEYGWEPPWDTLTGGGGLSLLNTTSDMTNCTFEANEAQISGAGVFAGNDTTVLVEDCVFFNNTTPGFGGGASVSSATFRGSTLFHFNEVERDGAAIFVWDWYAYASVESLECLNNTSDGKGGCMYTAGITDVAEDVVMLDNQGKNGGCVCECLACGG